MSRLNAGLYSSKTIINCLQCGQDFEIFKCYLSQRKFCSFKCRVESQKVPKEIKWNVAHNGCWICTSHPQKRGYPRVVINGKTRKIHRVLYEKYIAPIPEKACLLHSCDNPFCINPYHLRPGTHAENSKDMVSRRRQNKGEGLWSSKLTEEQVKEILKSSEPLSALAKSYGVSKTQISLIKQRKRWKHIDV